MVASVGSISIDLSTNAQKFATGFKSAATTVESQSARMAKSVSAVERSVAGIGSTLKTFVGGLAAGAGLAAIGSLSGAFDTLKSTISEYDKIASDSKTAGLKSDTFQALAFAAKQANVEYDGFNTSLTIFAKNAGLAERGTGALFAGLKKLNPQLLQNILNTQDQEERLKLVSDALARTTDATQKAALAAVVFGKGGVEMARFLDQGRASIDAMKKSARDMGLIVPDDLLQRAGELDDKLDVLSKVIHVQLGEAVINLAPLLEKATTGFANFSKEVNVAAGALTNFVNDPNWSTLEKLIVAIGGEPFRKDSILGQMVNGTAVAPDFSETTKAITFMEQKIAELQDQAAHGIDVHIELADAQQSLNDLEARLLHIQGVGVSAANEIRASFAEAFRAAENASMAALAAMQGASAPGSLPNVTRYGGDPNKITLPGAGAPNVQTNVNGSGVDVTKYSSATADNTKQTAGYASDTADNVDTLDRNTNGYFNDLGNQMARYSSDQVAAMSRVNDAVTRGLEAMPSAVQSAMTGESADPYAWRPDGGLNTGNISKPSNQFGTGWDPQHGSYVSGWGIGVLKRPSLTFPTTSSDGTYNNQVSVAQPGSDITLVYNAAAGESAETAKQRARDMYNELVRAQASA